MTTATFTLAHSPVQIYFHNLGCATRSLAAALIAAPQPPESEFVPYDTVDAAGQQTSSPDPDAADLLNALATEFEATQPNQAAELRWLASRG
jgi:hypothetical protein